jgi:microcystin-dependent protein
MTTPNIVPRGNGEGGIGTNEKFWKNGYFENLYTHDGSVATENHVQLSIKNHNDDIDAHSAAISKHNSATSVHTANLASKAEAEAGTDTSKFMTPARVSDAIKNFAGADLTGMIFAFAGNSIPSGFLLCDGSKVSRTTYKKLFDVIGTTYGEGDGSTTFNLPNLNNNSFLEGSNTVGTVKSAGLPNINGSVLFRGADVGGLAISETTPGNKGAFNVSGANEIFKSTYPTTKDRNSGQYLYIDASRSSSVYGNSITVQPKSVTVKFCIKY